jgi:hypothetical protein
LTKLLTILDPKTLLEFGWEQGQGLDALGVHDLTTEHGGAVRNPHETILKGVRLGKSVPQ